MTVRAGILGASGYTGAELLRLLAGHGDIDVVVATAETNAGQRVAELYPALAAAYGDLSFGPSDSAGLAAHALDVVFLGLPHKVSAGTVPRILGKGAKIIDLSGDFRLDDSSLSPYRRASVPPFLVLPSFVRLC